MKNGVRARRSEILLDRLGTACWMASLSLDSLAEEPVNLLRLPNREWLLGIPAGVGRREDDFSTSLDDSDALLAKELNVLKKDVPRGIPACVAGREQDI